MGARKEWEKELNALDEVFETPEEDAAWMRRYGVFPLRPPRFGGGDGRHSPDTESVRGQANRFGAGVPKVKPYGQRVGKTPGTREGTATRPDSQLLRAQLERYTR